MPEAWIEDQAGRVCYDVAGAGPAVMLLHPGGYDHRLWDRHGEPKRAARRCTGPLSPPAIRAIPSASCGSGGSTGQWKRYFASASPLHLKKSSSIDVYMTGGVVEATRYRVKIVFLADRDHLARSAPWAHFLAVRSQAR